MTTDTKNWIEVDRKGLADLIINQPKSRIIFELVQNAWDEDGVTRVDVTLRSNGHGTHEVSVIDDSPDGYTDIRHAWVLYAPSKKKADPTRRGRFNSGCKMVLALASSAMVISTQSAVEFTEANGRRNLRRRREKGTEFVGTFKMSKTEAIEAFGKARRLIPPEGITTTIRYTNTGDDDDSYILASRKPMRVAENVTLPTILADDEGVLRQRDRQTTVNIYDPNEGEAPTLYELGIPVLGLDGGEPWHIDVQQRVPLNQDRDNVTPRYLQKVRCAVIGAAHLDLTQETASAQWATDATEDYSCSKDATTAMLDLRFGVKRVAHDLSDPEANLLAAAKGYTVVPGGALTGTQWNNAKYDGLILPAGRVTPSATILSSPDGVPSLPPEKWTVDMQAMADYAEQLCVALGVRETLRVDWYADMNLGFVGFWDIRGTLGLNKGRMKPVIDGWMDGDVRPFLALLLHEFAHEEESNHLSSKFADEIAALGSRLYWMAIDDDLRSELPGR